MLTQDAIKELTKAQAIKAASEAVSAGLDESLSEGLVALPADFQLHDVEKHMPNRRRQRGNMTTPIVADFAAFVAAQKGEGAAVFVDAASMKASAVLNLGTPVDPGHADHTATFAPQMTAAYAALLKIAGIGMTQSALAEWLEDWSVCLTCYRGEGIALDVARAVSAVRAITIEGLRRVQTEDQNLSASKSAFESVKATATKDADALPSRIVFTCEPYAGMKSRAFSLRLSITTAGDKPALTLRVAKHEEHVEQMAEEVCALVRAAIGDSVPVLVGVHRA